MPFAFNPQRTSLKNLVDIFWKWESQMPEVIIIEDLSFFILNAVALYTVDVIIN